MPKQDIAPPVNNNFKSIDLYDLIFRIDKKIRMFYINNERYKNSKQTCLGNL